MSTLLRAIDTLVSVHGEATRPNLTRLLDPDLYSADIHRVLRRVDPKAPQRARKMPRGMSIERDVLLALLMLTINDRAKAYETIGAMWNGTDAETLALMSTHLDDAEREIGQGDSDAAMQAIDRYFGFVREHEPSGDMIERADRIIDACRCHSQP